MDKERQAFFMNKAYLEAVKAYEKGEVPIGAVIVKNNKVIAKAHNTREEKQNAVFHAELLAISKACKKEKSWRLDQTTMFVTMEPCLMCAGAALNARIGNVFFAFYDNTASLRTVAVESSENPSCFYIDSLNHRTTFCKSELEKECSDLLKQFFKQKRKS